METDLVQWLDEARNGNDEAFCQLVEHYQNGVFNLCYRMLGNRHEAEDAAQEVFWRAYNALHRYDPDRPFQTWLLSIASHFCIDQQRKRHFTMVTIDQPFEETYQDETPNPEKSVSRSESQAEMETLLNQLKPKDRAALVLRYWYDMSEKEIAETLSLSVSAVKSRLFRARKDLAQMLEFSAQESELQERECYGSQTL